MFIPPSSSSQMKLSQMTSIRNGEIPVVVVFFTPDGTPSEYKLLPPDEAIETLAVIERLRDLALAKGGGNSPQVQPQAGNAPTQKTEKAASEVGDVRE